MNLVGAFVEINSIKVQIHDQSADTLVEFAWARFGCALRFANWSEATAVGWGASAASDGASGLINYGGGDLKNCPIEVLEAQYPLRVLSYGLRSGSGGNGRRRGGLGIVREYETLRDGTMLTMWLERSENPAWGLFGGCAGEATRGEVEVDGTIAAVTKTRPRPVPKGAIVRVLTGGGGGYGPPEEREPEAVTADSLDGYIARIDDSLRSR